MLTALLRRSLLNLKLGEDNLYFRASQQTSTVQSLLLSDEEDNEKARTRSNPRFCMSLVNVPVVILLLSISISLYYHGFQGLLGELEMFLLSAHYCQ